MNTLEAVPEERPSIPPPSSKQLVQDAVRQSSPLSRTGLLERFFAFWFGGLTYNQIWEDPRVDLEGLALNAQSRVLTIASGGCNLLNYLVAKPQAIHAVDLNRHHLYLANLKIAALRNLPTHEDFFDFFGRADKLQNVERYRQHVRPHLDEPTRHYWDGGSSFRRTLRGSRARYFTRNFYNYGKLGRMLQLFQGLARLLRKNPDALLEATSLDEQREIYEKEIEPFLDNRFMALFASMPFVVYSMGIPPQQFEHLKSDAGHGILNLYLERLRRFATEFPIQDNYFAWQAFACRYDAAGRQAIPDYLRHRYWDDLRQRAACIKTHLTSLHEFLDQQADASLDRFVFLDSQDWMRPEQIQELWSRVARVGRPGTRILFRTGGIESPVETALSPDLRGRFQYERELSADLSQRDRIAIYGGVHVYSMP